MPNDDYVTLVASLPALGPILAAKHPPINRVRLRQRFRQLRPEHFAELESVADLLAWPRLPLLASDAEIVRRAERTVRRLSSPALVALLRDRMELRTLVAALRRRHAGQAAPARDTLWGYGRYVARIRANWQEADFGVGRAFPWLPAARERLEQSDAAGFERILLEAAWQQAARLARPHAFDFEAVAFYAARWHILDRWTRYDGEAAAVRFGELVDEGLEALPVLLAEEPLFAGAAG